MRRQPVLASLSVLFLGGLLAAPAGAATQAVSGGHLKIEALSKLTQGGKLTLVGFAWDGPARLFAKDFAASGLAATTAGDRSFSVAAEGPATLCEGLKKLGADKTALEHGRLSFRSADGPLQALKLDGITVGAVDCSKTPWTADLQVASLAPAEERTKAKDKDKTKKKDKAKKG